MKPENELTKKIESYLDGDMSLEERELFETQMANDPKLQKEVELHKDIHRALVISGKKQLKKDLNLYYTQYKEKDKNLKLLWPIITIAASITIVFFVFFGKNRHVQPNNVITLDSVRIHKSPEYADSAIFELNDTVDTKNKTGK